MIVRFELPAMKAHYVVIDFAKDRASQHLGGIDSYGQFVEFDREITPAWAARIICQALQCGNPIERKEMVS
ncbi:MAG: hypothetical protein KGL39_11905 [Patescibacteria group bacterium]|nr:hypothetical protein [Patescibacteria group bacterium]